VAVDVGGDVELVVGAGRDVRREALPDSRRAAGPQRVASGIPAVEVADDGDIAGVRCPDGEVDAVGAVGAHRVGAELVVEVEVRALIEEVQVVVAESCDVVPHCP